MSRRLCTKSRMTNHRIRHSERSEESILKIIFPNVLPYTIYGRYIYDHRMQRRLIWCCEIKIRKYIYILNSALLNALITQIVFEIIPENYSNLI